MKITSFNGDKMGDAILRFFNLTPNNAMNIIQNNPLKEQGVAIADMKSV